MTTIPNPIDDTLQIIGTDIENFLATNPMYAGLKFFVRYMIGKLNERENGVNIYISDYGFDVGQNQDHNTVIIHYYEQRNEQVGHLQHPLMIVDRALLFTNFINKQYSAAFGIQKTDCNKNNVTMIEAATMDFFESEKNHIVGQLELRIDKRNKYSDKL